MGSAGGTGSRPKEPQRYRPVKKRARFAATSDDRYNKLVPTQISSDEERVTTRRQAQESSSEESEVIEGSDDEKKSSPKALYSPPESDLSDEASLARRARRPAKAPAGTQAGLKMSLLTENEREAILRQERAPKPPKKAKRKRGIQRSSLKKTLKPKKKGVSGEESDSDEVEEGTPDPNPDEPAQDTAGTSEQEPKIKSNEIPDEEIQEPKQSEPDATPEPEQVQIEPKIDAEQPEKVENTPDQEIIVNLELVQESMELQVEPEQEPKTEIQEQGLPAEQVTDAIAEEGNPELPSDQDMKVAEENNQEGIQESEPTPEQAHKLAPEDKEPDSDDGSAAKRPKESE